MRGITAERRGNAYDSLAREKFVIVRQSKFPLSWAKLRCLEFTVKFVATGTYGECKSRPPHFLLFVYSWKKGEGGGRAGEREINRFLCMFSKLEMRQGPIPLPVLLPHTHLCCPPPLPHPPLLPLTPTLTTAILHHPLVVLSHYEKGELESSLLSFSLPNSCITRKGASLGLY